MMIRRDGKLTYKAEVVDILKRKILNMLKA